MHTQVRGGAPPFTRYADLRCGLAQLAQTRGVA
jgi:hypothetical protein